MMGLESHNRGPSAKCDQTITANIRTDVIKHLTGPDRRSDPLIGPGLLGGRLDAHIRESGASVNEQLFCNAFEWSRDLRLRKDSNRISGVQSIEHRAQQCAPLLCRNTFA